MSKPQTVILYQVYGSVDLFNQVKFSILTLYYHLKGNFEDLKIVIYTDKESHFDLYKQSIPIYIEPLSNEDIQEFKGQQDFIHRVKICVIKDCFFKYGSNIFYLDSDTYFTCNPQLLLSQISPTTSIMNSNDYDLLEADELFENNDWLLIRRAFRNFEYWIGSKKIKIPLSTRMWNAGVIGLSYENKDLLDPILHLTDQIYKNKPVFTAEQFAFSYYLQNHTQLISSGDVIFHYWRNFKGSYWKANYSRHLQKFFHLNKRLPIYELAEKAFELTQHHNEIIHDRKPSKLQKLLYRLKLIKKVAFTGKI